MKQEVKGESWGVGYETQHLTRDVGWAEPQNGGFSCVPIED